MRGLTLRSQNMLLKHVKAKHHILTSVIPRVFVQSKKFKLLLKIKSESTTHCSNTAKMCTCECGWAHLFLKIYYVILSRKWVQNSATLLAFEFSDSEVWLLEYDVLLCFGIRKIVLYIVKPHTLMT